MDIEDAFDKMIDRLVEVAKDRGEFGERLDHKDSEIRRIKSHVDEEKNRRLQAIDAGSAMKVAFVRLWRAAKSTVDAADGSIPALRTVVTETALIAEAADAVDDIPL